MKHFIAIVGAIGALVLPLRAVCDQESSVEKLTLKQCLELAMENNLQIQASEFDVKNAEGKVGQALSFYFPALEVESGYTVLDKDRVSEITLPGEYYDLFTKAYIFFRLKEDIYNEKLLPAYPQGTDPNEILDKNPERVLPYYAEAQRAIPRSIESGYLGKNQFGTTVSLTQPIFTGGKVSGRYKQAVLNRELEAYKKTETCHTTQMQICQAYYALSQGRALLDLATEMQSRFKMLKIITNALMKSRKSRKNQYDYMTIQVYANKVDHLKQQMETKVENGKLGLQLLIGKAEPVDITGNTELPRCEVQPLAQSETLLREQNPSWQQVERGLSIAKKEMEIAQADLLPVIGVTGSFTHFEEDPQYGYMPENSWEVMAGAQWHFPLGLQNVEAVKEKQAMYASAKLQAEFARKALLTKVRTILHELDSLSRELAFMEKAVADAKERTRLAVEGYRIEEVETTDMIKAQTEESDVRIEHLQVLLRYQNLLVEYATLMGWDLYEQLYGNAPH